MKYVFLAFLVFGLSISAAAQDNDEESVVTLPDDVMRQVVTRIAKFYFKPARRPTVIYFSAKSKFSETILKQEWLPAIKNITFELIDANSSQIDRKGYVIELVKEEKKKNTYTIQFGYGDLVCGAGSGNSWTLRVSRSSIRLWPDGGQWGWGCGSGGPVSGLQYGDVDSRKLQPDA